MTKPLISIIVPIYNNESYLADCIESVLAQNYRHFELLLIDDGSTDACRHICDEYQAKNARITAIHTMNRGVSAARNTGIEHSKGRYITFLDADDMLLPRALETLINGLQTKKAQIVLANYQTTSTVKNEGWPSCEMLLTPFKTAEFCLSQHMRVSIGGVCAKLYDAALFNGVRFSEEHALAEDNAVNMLLYQKASLVLVLPTVVYTYRQHDGSLSACPIENINEAVNWVLAQRQAYLSAYDLPDAEIRLMACHINLCIHLMNVFTAQMSLKDTIMRIRRIIRDPQYRKAIHRFDRRCIDTRSGLIIIALSRLRTAFGIAMLLKLKAVTR